MWFHVSHSTWETRQRSPIPFAYRAITFYGRPFQAVLLGIWVSDSLTGLRTDPSCRLARMSGSGATVFGLYGDCRAAAGAAKTVRRARTGWWVKPTVLR